MTRATKTRSALFTSIISLLLCVSMLVGTTFAWFTDVAETGLNQIVAGNLDVELLDADDKTVDKNTKLFTMPELWEPGAVAFAQLKVANVGNLDLQASMSINYEDVNHLNGHVLSEVLKYAVIDATGLDLTSREAVLEAVKTSGTKGSLNLYDFKFELEPGEKSPLQTLVVYWEPNTDDVDNLYNANNGQKTSDEKPLQINLGVKVFATQLGGNPNNEFDSFGPDYDENIITRVDTPEQLSEALEAGGVIVLNESVELTQPVEIHGETTLDLNGNTLTVPDQKGITVGENAVLTVDNGTVSYTSDDYAPFYATSNGVINIEEGTTINVTSTVSEGEWGMAAAIYVNQGSNSVVNIDGGVINVSGTYATGVYVAYANGGNHTVNFNGGTINVTGKEAIGLEVLSTNTLNLNGGTINVTGEDAVAFNVGQSQGQPTVVGGSGNTVVNLYNGNALCDSSDAAAQFATAKCVVKNVTTVSAPDEMAGALENAQEGDTIEVGNTTVEISNIPAGVTIAGNGAENTTIDLGDGLTITGDNVTIKDTAIGGSFNGKEVAIKVTGDNTTISNVEQTSYSAWYGIQSTGTANLTVEGSTIYANERAVYVSEPAKEGTLNIKDSLLDALYPLNLNVTQCDIELVVEDCTLNGWTSFGQIASASFTNTQFGASTKYGYAFFRPYSATTLTNCEFEAGYEIDTRFGAVTLVNCTMDGVLVTAENAAELFHTDSHLDNLLFN